MIALDGVRLRRGEFQLDVSAHFDRPVTGVYGPSGCGKSTLLHVIAGLARPDAGRVTLDGAVVADGAARRHVPAWKRRLGVVFQDARLLPHLTVRGNLRYGERLVPAAARRFDFGAIVDLLGLGALLERRSGGLSGGERQRVALGRALLTSPRALLLDEPLAALDPGIKRQILPFFERIRDELAIPLLYVSHDLRELLQLTDHLAVLESGALRGHGRYTDLALGGRVPTAGLVNVFPAAVRSHDEVAGLTHLALLRDGVDAGAAIRTPLSVADHAIGATVPVAVRPEDVALALAPVENISVQNQIPGRVRRERDHDGEVLVEVDIGVPLLVEVTRRTVESLRLQPGREVWCLVKSAAVQYLR